MPVETSGTIGVKYTMERQTTSLANGPMRSILQSECPTYSAARAKIMAKRPGSQSDTPMSLYAIARRSVHNGDDVDELNEYRDTPKIPYSARFFAIAM